MSAPCSERGDVSSSRVERASLTGRKKRGGEGKAFSSLRPIIILRDGIKQRKDGRFFR